MPVPDGEGHIASIDQQQQHCVYIALPLVGPSVTQEVYEQPECTTELLYHNYAIQYLFVIFKEIIKVLEKGR